MLPVAARPCLRAPAAVLGWKRATLAQPPFAERHTGHVVGGTSPLGRRTPSPTLLDVELPPADLLRLTDGRTAALRA